MKKRFTYYFILSAFLIICAAACGSDNPNDDGKSSSKDNVNANSGLPAYLRLEVPHLKGSENHCRTLVHEAAPYGVNYIVEWDDSKRAQRWSAYQLYDMTGYTRGSRNQYWGRNDPFQEDPAIPQQYRTTLSDYSNNHPYYQRGHILPSADRLYSKAANEQTFYLSNIQPQIGGFNGGVWLTMENHIYGYGQIIGWNRNAFRDTLYICKGGTIEDNALIQGVKGKTTTGLIIPNYYFMAILCVKNGSYKALGLWVKHESNNDTDIAKYAVTIDELERYTGIDFFCNLPDRIENSVESTLNLNLWGL